MVSAKSTDGMRGTGLVAVVTIEARRSGERELWNRLRTLPEPVFSRLDADAPAFGIVRDAWYEAAFVHSVVGAVVKGLSEQRLAELMRDAAREAVNVAAELRPTFATLNSPERLARLVNATWRSAFSDGTIRLVSVGKNRVSAHRTGWTGHHPIVCRFGMEALTVLYELAGVKDPKMTMTSCISNGQADCSAVIEW
jgi:hypothetical protein